MTDSGHHPRRLLILVVLVGLAILLVSTALAFMR